eukprot:COSAG03_NODE_327_length_8954_cov_3.021909_4_plen_385_part_00
MVQSVERPAVPVVPPVADVPLAMIKRARRRLAALRTAFRSDHLGVSTLAAQPRSSSGAVSACAAGGAEDAAADGATDDARADLNLRSNLAALAAECGTRRELLQPVHSAEEVVERVRRVGFCVLADVVPTDVVAQVCSSIVAAVHSPVQEAAEREWAATRARGHRIGTPGVRSLKQLLRVTQVHGPYLAEPRLIAAAERLFGGDGGSSATRGQATKHPTFVRVSCNDANVCMQGNSRGYWHADWPYNATNATHIPPPYPPGGNGAPLLHLTTIFMFSDFSERQGGTFVIPGSHTLSDNPATGHLPGLGPDQYEQSLPGELQLVGKAGSVFISDSRLWHSIATNHTPEPRVGLLVRYAPWWLNLSPTVQGSPENERMVIEYGGKN